MHMQSKGSQRSIEFDHKWMRKDCIILRPRVWTAAGHQSRYVASNSSFIHELYNIYEILSSYKSMNATAATRST